MRDLCLPRISEDQWLLMDTGVRRPLFGFTGNTNHITRALARLGLVTSLDSSPLLMGTSFKSLPKTATSEFRSVAWQLVRCESSGARERV